MRACSTAMALAALAVATLGLVVSAQDPLNIWIVHHSHDDTGWLRTVDEYYIYEVQYILDTVTEELQKNPSRKFIEVEMAFFARWWREQTAQKKDQVRQLVNNRQLVFVNGGWCMMDDAVPIYYAMIDQMTLGHEFITHEFGESAAPTTGWHIDPFGHSNVIPWLYNLTGFDQYYINRIDYRLKDNLKAQKALEFTWHGSQNVDQTMWIHMMDNHYCTPNGFNFEHGVTQDLPNGDGPEPPIPFPPSAITKNNEFQIAASYVNMARQRAAYFRTNNVLIPLGCDFTSQNAVMLFKNYDYLIAAINKYSTQLGATAQYTTLDDYAAAVKPLQSSWPTYTDDFFPYADNGQSYWTGFFTSRQNVKSTSRRVHAFLRATEYAHAFTRAMYTLDRASQLERVFKLKATEAVVQHHDGVTGTFRELVGQDYLKRLNGALAEADDVFVDNLGRLISGGLTDQLTNNASVLQEALSSGRSSAIVVYNQLSWDRKQFVHLTLNTPGIEIVDESGAGLPFQVNERDDGDYDVFVLVTVPALGYSTFVVEPITGRKAAPPKVYRAQHVYQDRNQGIENEYIAVELNNATNHIYSITNKRTGAVVTGNHAPYVYTSYSAGQSSGAYILRPVGSALPIASGAVLVSVVSGPLVSEIRSNFGAQGCVQIARLYSGLDNIEGSALDIDFTVGPLSLDREVVLRFSTDINNNNVFYTDNNGLELQRRTNNPSGRPGDSDVGVRIAGNYYPAVTRAFIRDEVDGRQLTFVSQATHGAASLSNGQLEVMLHRRCSRDDARGMNEPLNDQDIITAHLRIFVDNAQESARLQHRHAEEINFPLELAYTTLTADFPPKVPYFTPLRVALPENIQMFSFDPRDAHSDYVIIRVLNPFELGEHPTLSQPATINLSSMLAGFSLSSLEERTLTLLHTINQNPSPVVTVAPMQIRTFVARLVSN